ncbi:MAG: hypothetical protein KVP17_003565 [Porospora cf. gigantea B]|uniref:uncharacterized protein n=1 Tax=Porospora cf. gigantea B TaxID=2853592 RepID=UPI0035718EFB|nr:MAG: hypothetical protein KVP17_003565 [Porospora cf. gigantea B]
MQQFRRLNKEVVVRGIGLTNQNPYHCEWPRSLRIQVNDFLECIEPPDVDRKRRDVPIPITQYLRPGLNKLQFIATGVAQESVLVGVCLCNCETSESLARKIPEVPPEDTLQILQENLEGSDTEDCGVVNNDRENLRLNCSITLNRIQTPVRGYKCRHMQCFDLDSYLTVTAQSRAFNQRWKCPECHLVVRPADLRVDCLFRDILEKAPENAVEVLVLADGSWSVSQELQDRDETDLTDPDSEPAVMTIDSDSDCASPEVLELDSDDAERWRFDAPSPATPPFK